MRNKLASLEDWRLRVSAGAGGFVMNRHNEAAALCFSRAASGDNSASNSGAKSLDGRNASPTCPQPVGQSCMEAMDRDTRLKRLRFRAWHRGTKEADLLIGGFFDRHSASWNEAEIDWVETLLEEQDVDIMAWAIGAQEVPERYQSEMMTRLKTLNYIKHPE